MKNIFLLLFIAAGIQPAGAQNDNINDPNNIGWLQTFSTISLDKKWGIHAEYQWRRTDGLKSWQQSLLRTGVNYKVRENVSVQAGYAFIQTFSYGDYPVAANGTFPEHRLYEQAAIRHNAGRLVVSHRLRTEQRWLRRKIPGISGLVNDWYFLHRFRYQLRLQKSLWQKQERQFYAAAADELFIGAGKNLGNGNFDQNRLFLLIGYRINKKISLETGYLNQLLKQGRKINNRSVLQHNKGFILASYMSL